MAALSGLEGVALIAPWLLVDLEPGPVRLQDLCLQQPGKEQPQDLRGPAGLATASLGAAST